VETIVAAYGSPARTGLRNLERLVRGAIRRANLSALESGRTVRIDREFVNAHGGMLAAQGPLA
jgi:hypothetical protein